MSSRAAAALVLASAALLALSACDPIPAPVSTTSPSVTPTPKQTIVAEPTLQLPADAVLGLSAVATADNGASLNIVVVVLSSAAWNQGAGSARSSATAVNCDGELDASVFDAESFSFGEVDITATLASGSPAWPTDLPIQVLPLPRDDGSGPSLTAAGGVVQLEAPNPAGDGEPGYYVPHCLQNAFLPGAGSGSTYLGFTGDASTLTAWASSQYGITFDGFAGPADPARVTLTACTQVVTPLGTSLGAPAGGFAEHYSSTVCRVGA
jgi:hypothetical protein